MISNCIGVKGKEEDRQKKERANELVSEWRGEKRNNGSYQLEY